jgi:hypothetical protein
MAKWGVSLREIGGHHHVKYTKSPLNQMIQAASFVVCTLQLSNHILRDLIDYHDTIQSVFSGFP